MIPHWLFASMTEQVYRIIFDALRRDSYYYLPSIFSARMSAARLRERIMSSLKNKVNTEYYKRAPASQKKVYAT
jgi:hypothetical protein